MVTFTPIMAERISGGMVRLSAEHIAKVRKESKRLGVSQTELINSALNSYFLSSDIEGIDYTFSGKVLAIPNENLGTFFETELAFSDTVTVIRPVLNTSERNWSLWKKLVERGTLLMFVLSHPDDISADRDSSLEEDYYYSIRFLRELDDYSLDYDGVIKASMNKNKLRTNFIRSSKGEVSYIYHIMNIDFRAEGTSFLIVSDQGSAVRMFSRIIDEEWEKGDKRIWKTLDVQR